MVLWIWKLLEQFWRYFPPARRHLLGIHFWTFCLFSGYPNCGSFEAVLEIFLPSLEASLWETVLNILEVLWISKLWYLWSSFGDISHQFWRYFSTNVSMGYIFWIYGLYPGSPNWLFWSSFFITVRKVLLFFDTCLYYSYTYVSLPLSCCCKPQFPHCGTNKGFIIFLI